MANPKNEAERKEGSGHPWRDNIEAITMAVIMAVMLKYFIVEAYKIPTGSMQPTLMGNDETGLKDRILVDKLSYHFRDPERWEVTVFKYPLDLSKNFIKRCVGIGPEELKIKDGDLWNRPGPEAEWKVLRRPKPIQEEVWKPLYPGFNGLPGWKPMGDAKAWQVSEDEIVASCEGTLRYPPSGSVMDDYLHGYPLRVREDIRPNRNLSNRKPVGDLRLTGEVEALAGCTEVVVEMREASRQYKFILPGPAAPAGAKLQITANELTPGFNSPLQEPLLIEGEEEWKLEAGSSLDFAVQNMDDLLSFEIDGETLLELEIPAASNQASNFFLHVKGQGAEFEDVMLYRDIYYIGDAMKRSEWQIPEGNYVMLGDNTQDSSDSREWMLARIQHPIEGEIYRGNHRGPNENPRTVAGMPGGAMQWFRDEYGELHHWRVSEASALSPEAVPFVPRELITGRAVVVFWPLSPSYRLWRLQWVH